MLLGSSGAGKSTLINRLAGLDRQKVQAVREDGKGRHTTTQRELIRLPGGGLIIDTPGLRELQLWEGAEGLPQTFEEIEALAEECRFADCHHDREPGCAVREALDRGTLPADRLASFQKLQRELHHLAARQDQRTRQADQQSTKTMMKSMKAFQKNRGR